MNIKPKLLIAIATLIFALSASAPAEAGPQDVIPHPQGKIANPQGKTANPKFDIGCTLDPIDCVWDAVQDIYGKVAATYTNVGTTFNNVYTIISKVALNRDGIVDIYNYMVTSVRNGIVDTYNEVIQIAPLVDELEAGLATVEDFVQDAIDAADAAKDEAIDAAEKAETLVIELNNSLGRLSMGAQELVFEAAANLEWQVNAILQGRSQFLGNGCAGGSACYQFRLDLIEVIRAIAGLNNAMLLATPVNAEVDFQEIIDLINNMPGVALYPLYTAFTQQNAVSLPELEGILDEAAKTTSYVALTLKNANTCETILAERKDFEYALSRVQTVSTYLFFIGKAVNAAGEIFEVEGFGAAWGFAGGTVKVNVRQLVGTLLEGFGETGLWITDRGFGQLDACDTEVFRAKVLEYIGTSPFERGGRG